MRTKTAIFPLLPLYIVIFIGYVGYSLMITVFTPLLLNGDNGLLAATASLSERTIILGILLALYPSGQFFGAPILGALSDYFGRKRVLMISLCVGVLCYVLIAIALQMQNVTLLMISLLLAGLSESNVAIAQSAIADVSSKDDRSRLFGYINLSAASSYVIGPLFGGILASRFNVAVPFWGVCALLVLTTLWTLFAFRETKPLEKSQNIAYFQAFTNLLTVFTYRKVRILYLANFLFYLSIFGFFRCYPMYLVDEFHLDVANVSYFIAWVSVPFIFASFGLVNFLARRFSPKQITIWTGIFSGIFMLLIIMPNNVSAMWWALFLPALMMALCLPFSAAMLSNAVEQSEQGSVMGNNQALAVGAEALSGLIGGLLAAIAIQLPLIILAIAALIGGCVLFVAKADRAATARERAETF